MGFIGKFLTDAKVDPNPIGLFQGFDPTREGAVLLPHPQKILVMINLKISINVCETNQEE